MCLLNSVYIINIHFQGTDTQLEKESCLENNPPQKYMEIGQLIFKWIKHEKGQLHFFL